MAFSQIPHTGGCAARVKLVCNFIRSVVKFIVVHTLIDAHAPQDNAGVAAVLQDHLSQHFAGAVLPCGVADVLPAGQLGKDKQSQLVTFVQKVLALRVMTGADGVAVQLVFQNAGIVALQTLRRGVADVRVALVAVESAQERLFPV